MNFFLMELFMSSPETPEAPTLAEIEQALGRAADVTDMLHVLQRLASCLRSGAYALISRQQQAERSSPSGLAETLKRYRAIHEEDCLKRLKCRWCEQPLTRHSGHAFEPAMDHNRGQGIVACSCGLAALLSGEKET